jgi:chlorobactene glucosyltransferase
VVRVAAAAFILDVFALAALLAAFTWQVRALRSLHAPPAVQDVRPQSLHPVSIVLLLEDAELAAEPTVASVLSQDYPELELIVIDDRPGMGGAGASRRLAPDPRMRALAGGSRAKGWARRSHSFFLGYRETKHPWVLFIDDSVVLKDNALRRAMGAAWWQQADLLTIVPGLTATSTWERIFMPFVAQLALLAFPARALEKSEPTTARSYGPFLLVQRSAYEAVRGHAAIRSEPLEDVALIRSIQHRGYKPLFVRGHELAVVQTISSFPRMWQSLMSCFNSALSRGLLRSLFGAFLLLIVFAIPWLLLFPAVLLLRSPISASPWTGVIIASAAHIGMSVTYRNLLKDTLGIDRSLVWLQPIAAITAAAILVASHLVPRKG